MFIAKNFSEFKYMFAESLRDMLSPKEPGALILVLANSLQDEELRNQLKVDVQASFDEIKKISIKIILHQLMTTWRYSRRWMSLVSAPCVVGKQRASMDGR